MEKETNIPVQALKAHLALNVKSVERSMEFYRKMLGLEPVKVRRGYAKFDVQNPPLNLTLNERSSAGWSSKSLRRNRRRPRHPV
jgi:catechol-2,3-dioxygenase